MAAAGRAAPRCTARAGRARGRPATRPSRRAAGTALACLPRRAALRRALPASADLTQRAVGPTEQGVIYVVDSADRDRFQDARNELRVILVDGQIKVSGERGRAVCRALAGCVRLRGAEPAWS
mmetsp:Transcript_10444/g.29513  ORF Transcript_10444/g.29513 Transcript_10444/m.29513 type:complete len:123 (+) Transcript_10444:403-771(+)